MSHDCTVDSDDVLEFVEDAYEALMDVVGDGNPRGRRFEMAPRDSSNILSAISQEVSDRSRRGGSFRDKLRGSAPSRPHPRDFARDRNGHFGRWWRSKFWFWWTWPWTGLSSEHAHVELEPVVLMAHVKATTSSRAFLYQHAVIA